MGVIFGEVESCGDGRMVCWSFCAGGSGGGTQANPNSIRFTVQRPLTSSTFDAAQGLSSTFQASAISEL